MPRLQRHGFARERREQFAFRVSWLAPRRQGRAYRTLRKPSGYQRKLMPMRQVHGLGHEQEGARFGVGDFLTQRFEVHHLLSKTIDKNHSDNGLGLGRRARNPSHRRSLRTGYFVLGVLWRAGQRENNRRAVASKPASRAAAKCHLDIVKKGGAARGTCRELRLDQTRSHALIQRGV
jgi:hypothetical protein